MSNVNNNTLIHWSVVCWSSCDDPEKPDHSGSAGAWKAAPGEDSDITHKVN